jgi:ATP-dependent protease ClpP protease subunit
MPEQIMLEIPKEIENLQLPDPDLLMFYKNLEKRHLWIDLVIDDGILSYVRQIMDWNREDRDNNIPVEKRTPIYIYLQNCGGEISYMWLLTDIMEISKTPIYTVAMNVCASAAALIFMSGSKRYMLKNATILIHEGSISTGEQDAVKFMDASESYKKILKKMKDFILLKTKIDSKIMNKKKSNDWEIDSTYCLENGVCDVIVNDIDEIV